jgi:hypothetical protein
VAPEVEGSNPFTHPISNFALPFFSSILALVLHRITTNMALASSGQLAACSNDYVYGIFCSCQLPVACCWLKDPSRQSRSTSRLAGQSAEIFAHQRHSGDSQYSPGSTSRGSYCSNNSGNPPLAWFVFRCSKSWFTFTVLPIRAYRFMARSKLR